jgi:dipeptidyl aminopeptidase/acylaminoacyl peptidase
VEPYLVRAREILVNVRHAAMATVNEDGSPHNSPLLFLRDETLEHVYWGSHPDAIHSKNIERTGRAFFVIYDLNKGGGIYIKTKDAHEVPQAELLDALEIHNKFRVKEGKEPIPEEYYRTSTGQRMYSAKVVKIWVNDALRDDKGWLLKDIRREINASELI